MAEKLKLVFIDVMFQWPPRGGAAVDLFHVIGEAQKAGHDVHLVTLMTESNEITGTIGEKLPFPAVVVPCFGSGCDADTIIMGVKKAVDKIQPDLVMVSETWALSALIINALKGYKVISRLFAYEPLCPFNGTRYREHNLCPNIYPTDFPKCVECVNLHKNELPVQVTWEQSLVPVKTEEYRALRLAAFSQVEAVVVYNPKTAELVAGLGAKPVVITGGVDTARFKPDCAQKAEVTQVVMTGRVDDYAKGFSFLRRSARLLHWKGKKFKLRISGNKSLESDIVTTGGWIPHHEAQTLYQKSHICVVPSLWEEPFGLVAIEAMACGIPVVASRLGGLAFIVEDGVTGFLVEPKDSDQLAERLERLIDDPALQKRMGEAGRKLALEKYSWDKVYKMSYEPLFTRAAGNKGAVGK